VADGGTDGGERIDGLTDEEKKNERSERASERAYTLS